MLSKRRDPPTPHPYVRGVVSLLPRHAIEKTLLSGSLLYIFGYLTTYIGLLLFSVYAIRRYLFQYALPLNWPAFFFVTISLSCNVVLGVFILFVLLSGRMRRSWQDMLPKLFLLFSVMVYTLGISKIFMEGFFKASTYAIIGAMFMLLGFPLVNRESLAQRLLGCFFLILSAIMVYGSWCAPYSILNDVLPDTIIIPCTLGPFLAPINLEFLAVFIAILSGFAHTSNHRRLSQALSLFSLFIFSLGLISHVFFVHKPVEWSRVLVPEAADVFVLGLCFVGIGNLILAVSGMVLLMAVVISAILLISPREGMSVDRQSAYSGPHTVIYEMTKLDTRFR